MHNPTINYIPSQTDVSIITSEVVIFGVLTAVVMKSSVSWIEGSAVYYK
jgi:hypothetical protein